MTDRELLELAAKAAGIVLHWHEPTKSAWVDGPQTWDPLIDDGDAFRLAVKLGLEVLPDLATGEVDVRYTSGGCGYSVWEELDGDPCAAVRRAIVSAAAVIGRGMP